MTLGYRSSDAVITICQNNDAKSIEIIDINAPAEEMIGYKKKDIAKKPLTQILPPRIAEMMTEYVEYEKDANDVGVVLSKVQSFSIVGKDGKETGFRLKVVRADSTDYSVSFQLVLQNKSGARQNEALRKVIQENFKGHEVLDKDTDLPNRASLAKDVELLSMYSNKSTMRGCFAILQIDHFDELFSQYGRDACIGIIKHIAGVCRQSLRPDDVVGCISYKRVGVLLLDANQEASRIVYNRLRWQIAANPYPLPDRTTVGLSVSISFSLITGTLGDKTLVADCEEALDALGVSAVNALIEVESTDKHNSAAVPGN